jgi:LPXTG-motif cell wall-anchored protein
MTSKLAFVAVHGVAVVALVLSLAAAAYAQTPATDQYGTKAEGVSVSESQQQPAPAVEAEQSTLPNTGLSLAGAVVVGGALAGIGVALRRRERKLDSTD